MFTCRPVSVLDYYLKMRQTRQLDYYSSSAEWWVAPGGGSAAFGVMPDTLVDQDQFKSLCFGKMPDGREVATKGYARRFGYDLHFAPPKSVSLLAMLGKASDRAVVVAAHDGAVRRVLKYVFDHGLLRGRRGHAGAETEAASGYVAAIFRECTSRSNDPQLHSHCVIPNIATRSDCTIGALNNEQLLQMQNLVGSLYNAELATELQKAGYEVVRHGRNFEIIGFSREVISFFSKRRRAIEKALAQLGLNASKDRKAAEYHALMGRADKNSELTIAELEVPWEEALLELGFDIGAIQRRGHAVPCEPVSLDAAMDKAFDKSSVLERPKMLWAIADALQLSRNVDQIEVALAEASASLATQIGPSSRSPNKQYFSANALIDAELDLIELADTGRGRWVRPIEPFVADAIAARQSLSSEQIDAIRHALNTDAISIVEGSAGAGKSFALGAAAEAARFAGLDVFAIGSSWAATKVLAADTRTPEHAAKALTGFLNRLESGKIRLGSNSLVLLDEAGMVGTGQMAHLVRAVRAAGGKLILSGDTDQLKPIAAGAPMVLLSRVIGSSKMRQIRRQSVGWQRDASMLFAKGDVPDAVTAYDRRGHIIWADSIGNALEDLADRFVADCMHDQISGINPPCTSLAIASWNEDVLELNRQIRTRLQAAELISTHEVAVPIARRVDADSPLEVAKLSLAVGDRIAFGESVRLANRAITNADAATVLAVTKAAVTLQFNDRQIVKAPFEDLVGYRDEGEPPYPVMKHVFAATAHFSQGMTVDRCYVLAARKMDREALYVAMTRHRHNAHLYVDASRLPPHGTPRNPFAKHLPDQDAAKVGEQTALAQAKKRFIEEWTNPAEKLNASDFEADPVAWQLSCRAAKEGAASANRMELRARKRLHESALPGDITDRAGIPTAIYGGIRRQFRERFSKVITQNILAWILWVRKKVSEMHEDRLRNGAESPPARQADTFATPNSMVPQPEGSVVPVVESETSLIASPELD
ncbi:MAG: hypothetical protein Devi2KO_04070 [Devosia indica]